VLVGRRPVVIDGCFHRAGFRGADVLAIRAHLLLEHLHLLLAEELLKRIDGPCHLTYLRLITITTSIDISGVPLYGGRERL